MKIIAFVAAAMCFSGTIVPVAAQSNYPNKSIRLIYDSLPGADLVARIYADELAKIGGKPVVVENVTGAGGTIAADRLDVMSVPRTRRPPWRGHARRSPKPEFR